MPVLLAVLLLAGCASTPPPPPDPLIGKIVVGTSGAELDRDTLFARMATRHVSAMRSRACSRRGSPRRWRSSFLAVNRLAG